MAASHTTKVKISGKQSKYEHRGADFDNKESVRKFSGAQKVRIFDNHSREGEAVNSSSTITLSTNGKEMKLLFRVSKEL